MTDQASRPRHRGILVVVALVLLAASAAWLMMTRGEQGETRLFFGHWRLRHLLPVALLGWLFVTFLAAAISRKTVFAWIFVNIILGVTVFLLEIVGAVGIVSYPELMARRAAQLGTQQVPHVDVKGETFEDLASGWGFDAAPIPFHYRTDQRGFRNPKDMDDADVYIVGDSIVVAALTPFEDTVTARLAERWGVSTMNLALIGISPQKERMLLREAKLPYDGRLVLHYIFEGNDLLDSADERPGEGSDSDDESFLKRTFTYNGLMWLQRETADPLAREQSFGRVRDTTYLFSWLKSSFDGVRAEYDRVAQTVLETAEEVRAGGGSYGVVYMPAKIRVVGPLCEWPHDSTLTGFEEHLSPFRDWFLQWGADAGVPILDLTVPLQEQAQQGPIPWFPGDTHPDGEGHRVMADAIDAWEFARAWRESR